ncbi:hypothetical protein ACFQL7_20705 [Halocatena marina]|uniref:Uncharacterized protein n=1 Tax=Halocatena marina TaxID=2934937 RepID=A0ABD5YVE4_9EURY|nr:hypothetical protein [Halocatena marina]
MKLTSYTDKEPPVIREIRPLKYPTEPNKYIGFIGPNNRGQPGITCRRNRYESENGQHYYRKLGSYSFSEPTLAYLKQIGVKAVFIEEVDNDAILELGLTQFLNGIDVEEIEGDPQKHVKRGNALHEWPRGDCTILDEKGVEK